MNATHDLRTAMIGRLGTTSVPRDTLVADLAATSDVGSAATIARAVDALIRHDMTFRTTGERVSFVPAVTDNVSWTMRVDAADATAGYVRLHPALDAIGWWLVSSGIDLVDSERVVLGRLTTAGIWLDGTDTDVVLGPPGWLDRVADGWASLTVIDGSVRLDSLAGPPLATERQIDALRLGFASAVQITRAILFDGESHELRFASADGVIAEALTADRMAFVHAAVPYLPDLAAAAGFVQRKTIIAESGFDWDALDQLQHRNRLRLVHGLDDRSVDHLTMLSGACELYTGVGAESLGATDDERDGAAILLSAAAEDGAAASAVWNHLIERGNAPESIMAFLDELTERMEGVPLLGVPWLRSRCMEAVGDIQGSVALLDSVVTTGCTYLPAVLDAAGNASDRGDAVGALALIRSVLPSEIDPDDLNPEPSVRILREVVAYAMDRPRATVGRNDRCPCGSGRKYKVCHLGTERHSLPDRASWLYDKAVRYLRRDDEHLLDELAYDLAEFSPTIQREFRTGPFVTDLALHEHGLFDDFLESRGWLLPEDEALLAAQWTSIDRGVFEVLEIRGERLRLRDIGRGDTITIVNATPSSQSHPGMTVIGRPLPVGDAYRAFSGFMSIPEHLVDPVLDAIAPGSVDELVEVLAFMLRPPSLGNTANEELAFSALHLEIDDPNE